MESLLPEVRHHNCQRPWWIDSCFESLERVVILAGVAFLKPAMRFPIVDDHPLVLPLVTIAVTH